MIYLENIHKSFGAHEVLKGISGKVAKGEVIAIIGPSGSGKSTLLRTINLLDPPTSGKVSLGEKSGSDQIGMVFQQFNLFPHMTILDNLTYAPRKVRKVPRNQAEKRAKQLLRQVGLSGKEKMYPNSLSGGQKQRAAIGRALAMNPQIILFDEPTSSLDPEMVKEVLSVMQNLADKGMTMMVVTHEMGFAREVADRIWFIDKGKLVEDTPSHTFFKKPRTLRAKEFLEKVL